MNSKEESPEIESNGKRGIAAESIKSTKQKRNHSSNFHEEFIYLSASQIMDLKLREPKSDTRALADQAYAASPADAARCLQSWLPIGAT